MMMICSQEKAVSVSVAPQPSSVVYVYDTKLAAASNRIPHLRKRAELVHELISAYGLNDLMDCKSSVEATDADLLTFHSNSYLEFLSNADLVTVSKNNGNFSDEGSGDEESGDGFNDVSDEFGLGYDCPVFPDMKEFARTITGGTLSAANGLIGGAKVAINWCGGWHHAQRDAASGFCYVNDIVIGIQKLLTFFDRVLYVDLDVHHGDGVENAFSYSKKVFTLSFHNHETGYFPGTGSVDDTGFGKGKGFSINVPFKAGVVDDQFVRVFDKVFGLVDSKFKSSVIVLQCGADCLAGDPLGCFNLSEKSLVHCLKTVLERNGPVLCLGGGGYNILNTAKVWTTLTATILRKELPNDIPDNKYFHYFGPDFTLEVCGGRRKNENSEEFLESLLVQITISLQTNCNFY